MNPLLRLQEYGQSVWYDNIHRGMIQSGELDQMIREDGLRGITSNPTIFEKAIAGGTEYNRAIARHLENQPDITNRDLFFALAMEDVQAAADRLAEVYKTTDGQDGMVSLEVSPDLAYDTEGTIAEAKRLWEAVNRPNLMIKVPATKEGLPAVEALVSEGINVNATLLFSVSRYREVANAYLMGLETRLRRGQPVSHIASVASFFVSRVDGEVDKRLQQLLEETDPGQHEQINSLLGKAAIANAKLAYHAYQEIVGSHRFAELEAAGVKPQRLLWASTGTKNPDYSDVVYIDSLIGPNTINTMPPATFNAFREHGMPQNSLESAMDEAPATVSALHRLGIDLEEVTDELEKAGVEAFAKSFNNLLEAITTKAAELQSQRPAQAHG